MREVRESIEENNSKEHLYYIYCHLKTRKIFGKAEKSGAVTSLGMLELIVREMSQFLMVRFNALKCQSCKQP